MSASSPLLLAAGADDAYAMPLAVTLHSALSHLAPGTETDIYVVDGGLSADSKHRLERVVSTASSGPTRLHWAEPDLDSVSNLPTHEWINQTTYLRLLLPRLLPDDRDRVLYLDSDLLVQGDLTRLWAQDVSGFPLAAARACGSPYVSSPRGVAPYESLGLDATTPYFNAGVLLVNLPYWRRRAIPQQVFRYLRTYGERVQMLEQEGLNAVLAGHWKPLDLRWNAVSHLLHFKAWPDTPFKARIRARRETLIHDPYVHHFAGGSKPWQIACTHPAQLQWIAALWASAWFPPAETIRRLAPWIARNGWWRLKRAVGAA